MAAPSPTDAVSGTLSVVAGAAVVGIGAGVVPVAPGALEVSGGALAVCGALAALGGVAMLARRWPAVRAGAVAAMFAAFGAVGGWVAVHVEARHLAGGIGVFPDWVTVALARGVFGFGAALCLGLAVWAAARLRADDGPEAG